MSYQYQGTNIYPSIMIYQYQGTNIYPSIMIYQYKVTDIYRYRSAHLDQILMPIKGNFLSPYSIRLHAADSLF